MNIADIRTHLLRVPYTDPPQTGFITLEHLDLIVVEVETSTGVVGVGYLQPLVGGMRTIEMCIHEMMKPLLLGESGRDVEALWRKMWQATFIQGRMGITVMAMSALDIALWDALGKALGLTFQQIQKYEKGVNRIGASRIFELSQLLDVPIQYFYEDYGDGGARVPGMAEPDAGEAFMKLVNSPEGVELCRYFSKIKDQKVKKRVLDLVKTIAETEDLTNA